MEPKTDPIKEVLSELFGLLETSETQTLAVLQFLKDEGIATEEKLEPYLDRAGNASSVRWRAARARMEYLLTPQGKKGSDTEGEQKDESKPDDKPGAASDTQADPADKKPQDSDKPSQEAAATNPQREKKPPKRQGSAEKSAVKSGKATESSAERRSESKS
jgi:hypothetical protein